MAEPLRLVSVHDLMPDTMPAVREVVAALDAAGVRPLTLLVVPGHDWSEGQIDWLRTRQAHGDTLAGHGWVHHAGAVRNLYDRLHRRFFSRGVAEHLALETDGICELMIRCHRWFVDAGLHAPEVYVPPAWAMGAVDHAHLRMVPFRLYETLTGFYDAERDRVLRVPLVGYEADTRVRALSLRLSNGFNRMLATVTGNLRVAIHPQDLNLLLAADLRRMIERPAPCGAYL